MGMSTSGRRGGVPHKLAPHKLVWCLAGTMTLGLSAGVSRAGILAPESDEIAAVAGTIDPAQEAATAPATAPASPTTGPFLPGASQGHRAPDQTGDITRSDQGEIVPLEEPHRGPLRFSLTGLFMYGGVIGHAQTPVGALVTSTSANRPSLSAIGIDDTHIGDGEFGIGWENQQVFLGAQYNHMSGNAVLGRSLVSGGVTFPAHTSVSSNIRMDWYRLGYRYTFALDTAPNGVPDFTFTPMIDVLYWDYGYSLSGGRIGQANKSLTKYGFQLGATIAWRPNGGPLSLEVTLAGFPQSSRLANVTNESFLARYRFYQYKQYDFNFLLGVAWEQESFNDHQRGAANNISANFGPMLLTGLQMNF